MGHFFQWVLRSVWYLIGVPIGNYRHDRRLEAHGAGDHEGEAADENVQEKDPKKDVYPAGHKLVSQGVTSWR